MSDLPPLGHVPNHWRLERRDGRHDDVHLDTRQCFIAGSPGLLDATFLGSAEYQCIRAGERLGMERESAGWLPRIAESDLHALRNAAGLLTLTGCAAAVALTHMNSLPAFIVIGPGYVVQAWLFENHHALGGFGYQVTMVGVSALVWTLIILGAAATVRLLQRLMHRA